MIYICKQCKTDREDLVHLLWECQLARQPWSILSRRWLEIDIDLKTPFDLEQIFKKFAIKDFKLGGLICLSGCQPCCGR